MDLKEVDWGAVKTQAEPLLPFIIIGCVMAFFVLFAFLGVVFELLGAVLSVLFSAVGIFFEVFLMMCSNAFSLGRKRALNHHQKKLAAFGGVFLLLTIVLLIALLK